ncbi:glycosyltransferase, partial [Candidatus Falkowbacteria bacterium]|nr:glycosyltransferase [Candidatus Falkowbacteria bacterium]
IDNWAVHSSYKRHKDQLLKNYEIIDAKSDLIYTVSQELTESFSNKHVSWLPNAVDFDHFQGIETVRELADKPRPIIGFLGILQDRIDTQLLEKIAKRYTDATLVLAGPVWKGFPKEWLMKFPNIVFAGPVSYRNIPKFYNTFDVGIITYNNSEFIKSTNSMKYYEYLAAGLPVVSTWSGGIEKFTDVMYVAHTHDEFLDYIQKALDENTPQKEQERKSYVQDMTWKNRVDEILRTIDSLT